MQPKAQLKAPTLEDPTSKVPYVSLHFLLSRGFGSYFFPFGGVGGSWLRVGMIVMILRKKGVSCHFLYSLLIVLLLGALGRRV